MASEYAFTVGPSINSPVINDKNSLQLNYELIVSTNNIAKGLTLGNTIKDSIEQKGSKTY